MDILLASEGLPNSQDEHVVDLEYLFNFTSKFKYLLANGLKASLCIEAENFTAAVTLKAELSLDQNELLVLGCTVISTGLLRITGARKKEGIHLTGAATNP